MQEQVLLAQGCTGVACNYLLADYGLHRHSHCVSTWYLCGCRCVSPNSPSVHWGLCTDVTLGHSSWVCAVVHPNRHSVPAVHAPARHMEVLATWTSPFSGLLAYSSSEYCPSKISTPVGFLGVCSPSLNWVAFWYPTHLLFTISLCPSLDDKEHKNFVTCQ